MAQLEAINHVPRRAIISNGKVNWERRTSANPIIGLPQIFWENGHPWPEANHWAYDKVLSDGVKLTTTQNLMAHLHKYACWLEKTKLDWRHFPTRKSERVLVLYRGSLIEARNAGDISPSTATARMRSVIQFYRHCAKYNFIHRGTPKWADRTVIISYFDSAGFERTLSRITSDISIPNRSKSNFKLEDGLLPITSQHMSELLQFTSENASEELHLMLTIGFFVGARISTITSLRIENFVVVNYSRTVF